VGGRPPADGPGGRCASPPQQQGHTLPAATAQLREARGSLTQAEALLKQGDAAGPLPFILRRNRHWRKRAADIGTNRRRFPLARREPCCADFSSIPLHWQLAERLQQSKFSDSSLAGGGLDELSSMVGNGWKQHRHVPSGVAAEVAVVSTGQHGGSGALQLLASKESASPPELIERPSLGHHTAGAGRGGAGGARPRLGECATTHYRFARRPAHLRFAGRAGAGGPRETDPRLAGIHPLPCALGNGECRVTFALTASAKRSWTR